MTYLQALTSITKSTHLPEYQAWWVLEKLCDKPKEQLLFSSETISKKQQTVLELWITELASGKPLAYILKTIPFGDLILDVKPPLLIPRPETEEFTYKVIDNLHQPTKILDLGIGTGCIAISLAKAFPQATVIGTDINQKAIEVANKNSQKNLIQNTQFILADLYQNLPEKSFDVIVSNPPYIPNQAQDSMSASVLDWEDHNALFSGADGLDCIRRIIKESINYFDPKKNCFLGLEIDRTQGPAITAILQNCGFTNISIEKDMFGNTRFAFAVYAKRNSS